MFRPCYWQKQFVYNYVDFTPIFIWDGLLDNTPHNKRFWKQK